MKRWISLSTFTLLAILPLILTSSLVRPSYAQTIPAQGIGQIVCILGVDGVGTYGRGELIVTVESDVVNETTDIGVAVVTIKHGQTSSTHTVTYEDTNESGDLDCGDTIISVT